ncbi:TPA: hypothetical protein U2D46_001361 [Streptococcus suis]|uniref:hypothetical protein n=1 Tax=Streptococcus suis TaxID=1307 RepID=UPI001582AE07|nr:hypothetical protein [Streptococcus suis]MCK3889682.1 hypothetical protein [Streptococcus suis]MDW8732314.1 hypothetical protein [Streptococcus suis]HEL1844645.1 hypothetical protein [Streptococcus suis]HEM4281941.1 hypothetical protein [Streptococcus suis]HEM4596221.1 hypothetical protein [Streptococcus suis]
MKKINSNKKGILITGTGVVRGVQVLVALYSIYSFVQTVVFGQEMDMMPLMMMSSLLILEDTLSREKEKKNEQDN